MPSCFAASGSVRAIRMPQSASCAMFAEQLAPADLASQRGRDPPLLLLGRAVHHQRRQRPRAHAQVRTPYLRLAELVVDDELLQRAGVTAPRLRPLRREVAGVGEAATLLDGIHALDLADERTNFFA